MHAETSLVTDLDLAAQDAMALRMRSRKRARAVLASITKHFALILVGLIFLLPVYWMVSSALKPNPELFVMPPKWIPSQLLWDRFPKAFAYIPFLLFTWNTSYITLYNVIATLVSCTLVAYGFGVLQWRGREFFFYILIATMILPYQVTLIPQYIIFSKLHWINTFLPLTFPAWFGTPFLIFLMRQFFMTIPIDLLDAAKIDGASHPRILWSIFLPLSMPALATMAIFTFMWNWNDFLGPLIYLSDPNKMTLTLGLYNYIGPGWNRTEWGMLLAASTMITIPPVVLFFFTQRYFIEGISVTGIKG
jgi:multiple sugar transport system permease protein